MSYGGTKDQEQRLCSEIEALADLPATPFDSAPCTLLLCFSTVLQPMFRKHEQDIQRQIGRAPRPIGYAKFVVIAHQLTTPAQPPSSFHASPFLGLERQSLIDLFMNLAETWLIR